MLDNNAKSILKTLLYYDIFNYPLTLDEIANYVSDESILAKSIEELKIQNLLLYNSPYYGLNNMEENVKRRTIANEFAAAIMPKAIKSAKVMAKFPFVQGVCISGSLSKKYFDEKSDVDFFIITKPNRLWLCRTLLMLYKKVFLFNSRKYFCANYFVSEENLEIPDKNIFTAVEIATLLPVHNYELYKQFFNANNWIREYFPNSKEYSTEYIIDGNTLKSKKFTEYLLGSYLGELLDKLAFRVTIFYWKRKFKNFNEQEFDLHLRSRKNVSKHHPQGMQKKVIDLYSNKIADFEKKGIVIS
ncbi:MAG: nucleotidyltransferase domain-containing protein [Bacteroidetes bacterium]|nr:nucleotidyltransferase domain-containing protein [Bacteroidota bacterium]